MSSLISIIKVEEELLTCLCSPRCQRPVCETPWCNELHQRADARSPSSASGPCMRQQTDVHESLSSQKKADFDFIYCFFKYMVNHKYYFSLSVGFT